MLYTIFMRRLLLILPVMLLLGQGCLDDPPQPNRPILYDYFNRDTDETAPTYGVATDTRPEAPALKKGEIGSPSRTMVVSSIVPKQELSNPFVILGRAAALQNAVYWRVKDANGTVVASGAASTDAQVEGGFGGFRARAFYDAVPSRTDGQVQVFSRGPGGVEQDVVSIPVTLVRSTTPLKVFFLNQLNDPELKACDKPEGVTRRIPKTEATAEAAMTELLKGPTAQEQTRGSRTAIVPGTSLHSIEILNSVATVDFSRQFILGIAGSCNVQALRSQVEQTLKQFPNVKTVKILVEGADAEESLQP
jgi:hypothetical protein